MKQISISTCFDYSIPLHEQLPLIKKAGFSHVSLGGNYNHSGILNLTSAKQLGNQLASHALAMDTIHCVSLDMPDALETTKQVAEAAVLLSAPVIVLHCSAFDISPEQYDRRRKDLLAMLPPLEAIAKDAGIRFALENVMPGVATELVTGVLAEANPLHIGFCYDSSHDQVDGPRLFTLLEQWKHRLLAVHLSDRIMEFVDHVLPGEGFIAFDEVCALIRQSGYKAPLLMEVMMTHSKFKEPAVFLREAYLRAEALYDRIYEADT